MCKSRSSTDVLRALEEGGVFPFTELRRDSVCATPSE
jgi:hypothetical protein